MKSTVVMVSAILCLTIICVAFIATQSNVSPLVYTVCTIIGGIAGATGQVLYPRVREKLKGGKADE